MIDDRISKIPRLNTFILIFTISPEILGRTKITTYPAIAASSLPWQQYYINFPVSENKLFYQTDKNMHTES